MDGTLASANVKLIKVMRVGMPNISRYTTG